MYDFHLLQGIRASTVFVFAVNISLLHNCLSFALLLSRCSSEILDLNTALKLKLLKMSESLHLLI